MEILEKCKLLGQTEQYILKTLVVEAGTSQTINGRVIRIGSRNNIICRGHLTLENCVIYVNEQNYSGHIFIREGGRLSVQNCIFLNSRYSRESFFLQVSGNTAVFNDCLFKDCVRLILSETNLKMSNCLFYNCLIDTVCCRQIYPNTSNCVMENIDIVNLKVPAEIKSALGESSRNRILNLDACNVTVSNVRITESAVFTQEILKRKDTASKEYSSIFANGLIEHLQAKNTTLSVFTTIAIQDSLFENCMYALHTLCENHEYWPSISTCQFKSCSNAVVADQHTTIFDCNFEDCSGSLIKQKPFSSAGGISVDACRFIRCKNEYAPASYFGKLMNEAMPRPENALLFFSGSNYAEPSAVKNCIFEDIIVDSGYYVATDTLESFHSYIASIDNCQFRNCYTNRDDCEIFKMQVSYYGAFSREKTKLAIEIRNCKGLDLIQNDYRFDLFAEDEFDEDDLDK